MEEKYKKYVIFGAVAAGLYLLWKRGIPAGMSKERNPVLDTHKDLASLPKAQENAGVQSTKKAGLGIDFVRYSH